MFYTVTCTEIAGARVLYHGPREPITETPERAIEVLAEEIRDYARLIRDHYGYEAREQERVCRGMLRMLRYFDPAAENRAYELLRLIKDRDPFAVEACADACI